MTKSYWDPRLQKLVPTGSHGQTVYDDYPWPTAHKIPQASNSEVASVCLALNIKDAGHNRGRGDNLKAYAAYIDDVRKKAGDDAVAQLLKGFRHAAT